MVNSKLKTNVTISEVYVTQEASDIEPTTLGVVLYTTEIIKFRDEFNTEKVLHPYVNYFVKYDDLPYVLEAVAENPEEYGEYNLEGAVVKGELMEDFTIIPSLTAVGTLSLVSILSFIRRGVKIDSLADIVLGVEETLASVQHDLLSFAHYGVISDAFFREMKSLYFSKEQEGSAIEEGVTSGMTILLGLAKKLGDFLNEDSHGVDNYYRSRFCEYMDIYGDAVSSFRVKTLTYQRAGSKWVGELTYLSPFVLEVLHDTEFDSGFIVTTTVSPLITNGEAGFEFTEGLELTVDKESFKRLLLSPSFGGVIQLPDSKYAILNVLLDGNVVIRATDKTTEYSIDFKKEGASELSILRTSPLKREKAKIKHGIESLQDLV